MNGKKQFKLLEMEKEKYAVVLVWGEGKTIILVLNYGWFTLLVSGVQHSDWLCL